MTKVKQVLEYIRQNPIATNKEIANNLKIEEGTVKVSIHRLKKSGCIKKDEYGEYLILKEVDQLGASKREIYTTMIDVYLEDFIDTNSYNQRVEIGKMILKILEML